MRETILITGASSGIGRGMAREFAARGRSLALCARRTGRLEQLRDELLQRHPDIRVVIHRLDVTDHDAVFEVFRAFNQDLGTLDRIIVNAGMGKGQPLGTGYFHANRQTAETNFVGALAQCEAAMELFRARGSGHLVIISSIGAMRGLPKNLNTYSATKAGVAALAEGLRCELIDTPIKVTTVYPGYIRSELSEKVASTPFMIGAELGSRLLVQAIEREPDEAVVPGWPWRLIGPALRHMPLRWVRRFT